MQVIFLGNAYTLNNTLDELSTILNEINQKVQDQNLVLSHFNMDGVDIYGPLDELMGSVNLETIQNIEVVAITERDLVLNILKDGYEYLNRALPEIEKLITSFYYEEKSDNWIKFQEFIEGMQWLIQLTEFNQGTEFLNNGEFIQIQIELKEQSSKMLSCLENQDVILLADIMSYEVVPVLNRLMEKLQFIVESNGDL